MRLPIPAASMIPHITEILRWEGEAPTRSIIRADGPQFRPPSLEGATVDSQGREPQEQRRLSQLALEGRQALLRLHVHERPALWWGQTGRLQELFELARTAVGGVLVEDTLAGGAGDPGERRVRRLEGVDGLLRAAGDEELLAGRQESGEPFPVVTEERGAAGGGFEEAAGRAVAHLRHRAARDVERQPGGAEEGRVLRRRDVPDEEYVLRPGKVLRIHGAAEEEAPGRQPARGLDEERAQRRLPVGGVGAEIGEVGAIGFHGRDRVMPVGIGAAIEGSDAARAKAGAQLLERLAAGEGQ